MSPMSAEEQRKRRDDAWVKAVAKERLNRAAPDLLAACQEAYEWIDQSIEGDKRDRNSGVMETLRLAIQKATGEKP